MPVRTNRTASFALVLGLVAALASCSDDVFTREDAVERLRDAGVPAREAECVIDGVIDRVDLDVLNEEREPTASEQGALDEIRAECVPEVD